MVLFALSGVKDLADDTTSKFLEAVTKDAEEKRSLQEKETQEYIKNELDKAERETLQECYTLIQRKSADIRERIGRELSGKELECRKALFLNRVQHADAVFNDVKDRLIRFTKTEDYRAFLRRSAQSAASLFHGAAVTVYVRPDDLQFKDEIVSAYGSDCTVESEPKIRVGGLRFIEKSGRYAADDTLDSRLDNQHAWFEENSGLQLTTN